MSIFALLPAVRDHLRQQLNYTANECRVMRGPQPPARCGDIFLSIYALSWTPGDPDWNRGLDEYYGVACCISQRIPFLPDDERGEELYIKHGTGIETLARRIMTAIHQNIDVMGSANSLIADSANRIIEPLRWQTTDSQPVEVGPEWFSAETRTDRTGSTPIAGWTMTVNFDRARRCQAYDNMQ